MKGIVRSVVFLVKNKEDGHWYHVLTCGHAEPCRWSWNGTQVVTDTRRRCFDCVRGRPAPFTRVHRPRG